MSVDVHAGLGWLPEPPNDFRARCRGLSLATEAPGREIAFLAGHALDETASRSLAGAIRKLQAEGCTLAPLTPLKLGVVGNATMEHLVPPLVASAARHGIALECVVAEFGQSAQEALGPDSRINRAKPDVVLLALDHRGLPFGRCAVGQDHAAAVTAALQYVDALRDGFRRHSGSVCLVQTVALPPESLFGSLDSTVPGTTRALLSAFNMRLSENVGTGRDVLFDVAALAETVGTARWFSPTHWNMAKFPFDANLLPLYAEHVGRLLGALRGKSRRCLILDLDNTLWGGVVGDDGVDGIVLGQGDGTGEAFIEFQRYALALRARGIVLAICSKNDDDVARRVFREHPDMLLREHHIAVFQANWDDKATNIAAIARELSLGIDAMVFVDDNPAERCFVRSALPEVAVPELPEDPAFFARTLAAAGYFEAIAFSEEDRERAEFYQRNAKRAELQTRVGDLDAYLASLDMRIEFRPFDTNGRSRISQLINKSNQFNLTTRRYSEQDVAALESDPGCFTLQVRLADSFGDNGMISVVICRPWSTTTWEIDTWLMSCRVLGRRVEQMVLREMLAHARAHGVTRLVGTYVPTERNGMVRDHYEKLGFSFVREGTSGTMIWQLDTAVEIEEAPMTVERTGFELATV